MPPVRANCVCTSEVGSASSTCETTGAGCCAPANAVSDITRKAETISRTFLFLVQF
jgi:hypothetical protein